MNKLEQAARQALEALIKANHFHDYEDEITALREALAQEDKPHVVRDGGNWGMGPRYKCSACDEEFRSEHRAHWHCQNECKALAQPQEILGKDTCLSENQQGSWVDLTVDEINTVVRESFDRSGSTNFRIVKNTIAKFKEKNTPPVVPQDVIKLEREIIKLKAVIVEQADKLRERDVPQGEPVAIGAYEVVNEAGNEWELVYPEAIHKYKMIPENRITQTFYTTPPTAALAARQMRDAAVKVCRDYQMKCLEAEDWDAEDVVYVLNDLIAALPLPEVNSTGETK